jgi:hypothetical protein
MPISASQEVMKALIKNALTLKTSANNETIALLLTSAVASVAPTGLFPMGATMVPLAPTGFDATKSMIKAALSLKQTANNDTIAQMMASGYSVLCPLVPPAAIALLQISLTGALNLRQSADNDRIASQMAASIINYYLACGVV